jgi:hypothetical protein
MDRRSWLKMISARDERIVVLGFFVLYLFKAVDCG